MKIRHSTPQLGVGTDIKSAVRLLLVMILVFLASASGVYTYTRVISPEIAHAATSSNLNYQARLLKSNGSLVDDGYYNIEFKLYDAATAGTELWTEEYYDSNGATAGNDNRVRVVNGYMSVYLGSQNPLPDIDWSQDVWITLNVGGAAQTATPTYDGEMDPRIKLTSVPYALQATRAEQLSRTDGTSQGILEFDTLTDDRNILLPDEDGTICLQGSVNCGFLTGDTADYIQNGTNPQTADFNITGDGTIGGNLAVNGGAITSTGALSITSGAGTALTIDSGTTGAVNIGTGANDKTVTIGSNTGASPVIIQGGTSGVLVKPANGTTAFQIQNSSSKSLFTANTTANTITVGSAGDFDAFTKLSDPAVLPDLIGLDTAFSPDGTYMSVVHVNSPYITIYKRSGDTFTKLTNPSTLPTGIGRGVAFSPDGTYMSVAHSTSPYITIYKRSGDTFTKLTNPSTLPTNDAQEVAFSADGTYMSVAHSTSPYITIYKRSGDTFTKLTNPSTLPTGSARGVAFSPDGTYMSVTHSTSPFLTIYKRSGDTFTKLADPSSLPAFTGNDTAFSPDGTYMSVAHTNSPYITIYKRSGDTFTKLADPSTLPTGSAQGVAFSPDGTYLSVAHNTSPFLTIYKRSGDTFTKLTNPSTLPGGEAYTAVFSPTGTYMSVSHTASPYVNIYKTDNLGHQTNTDIYGQLRVQGTNGPALLTVDVTTSMATIKNLTVSSTLQVQGGASIAHLDVTGDIYGTGAVKLQNITNSSTAFQVQNSGGSAILNVDTSSSSITAGAILYADVGIGAFDTIRSERSGTSSIAYATKTYTDTNDRFAIDIGGMLQWGSGSGVYDTSLYRSAAGELSTNGNIKVAGFLQFAGDPEAQLYQSANDFIQSTGHLSANLDIWAREDSASQVIIGAQGPSNEAAIFFGEGSGNNGSIYLAGANSLQTDSSITIQRDADAAFLVQDSFGAAHLTVDSNGSPYVIIGDTSTANNSILLVLDHEDNDPGHGMNGAMYYNTTDNKFRCYEGGIWKDCIAGAGSGARVRHDAAQTFPTSGTLTPIAFNTEAFDTDAIHDTATNNTRLTAQKEGIYTIHGAATLSASPTAGTAALLLRVNGTTLVDGSWFDGTTIAQIDTQYYLNEGDYVELIMFNNTGGSVTMSTSAWHPVFSMVHNVGGSGGGVVSLQGAYNVGNTIATTNGRDIDITLAETTTDPNFIIDIATGSTGEFQIEANNTDILQIGAAGQLQLDVQGSGGGILLGGDAQLYRSAANTISLGSNDELRVIGSNNDIMRLVADANAAFISGINTSTADWLLTSEVTGDANKRFVIETDGDIEWGDGTNSGDTNLYRESANTLATGSNFAVYQDIFAHDDLNVTDQLRLGASQETILFSGGAGVLVTETSGSNAAIRVNVDDTFNATLQLWETNDRGFNLLYDAGDGAFILQTELTGATEDILWIDRVDGSVIFQNSDDSPTAFQIQDEGGSEQFLIDTDSNRVYIGDTTANGTGTLLILDTKNTTGDPTGVNGGMYYNSATGSFRCYRDGAWQSCGPQTKTLTSDSAARTATSYADVTGLTFAVAANTDYRVECEIIYTSAATNTGGSFGFNGPASPNTFIGTGRGWLSTYVENEAYFRTYNFLDPFPSVDAANTPQIVHYDATLRNGVNSGTLALRYASSDSGVGVTIKAGTTCSLTQL